MTHVRPAPYMVVTKLRDGTYTIWFQEKPEKGKQKLLQTFKAMDEREANEYTYAWEQRTGVRAVWRRSGQT